MIFEREFLEAPSLIQHRPVFLLFEKISYPLAETTLTLSGVKSVDVVDQSHIGTYTFNECSAQDNIYTFKFCEAMHISIALDSQPNGSLVDQQLLDKHSQIFTLRFLNLFSIQRK